VKIEGADYRLQKNEMLDWLSIWGVPLSDLKEEMHEASIDPDTDSEPLGTGEYSVKMDFCILPPQHIPMCGKRIRIYYKGIAKKCGKCFGDHRPTECDQERVPWINYIRDFREDYPEIKDEMYGRWLRILNEEQAAGKMAQTPRIWTRTALDGTIIYPKDNQNEENPTTEEAAPADETSEESDDSTLAVTDDEDSEQSEEGETNTQENTINNSLNLTKEHLMKLKKDCKSAGVDAVPALEALENTLFGGESQSEIRQQRSKKPRSKGQADEDECVKRIDRAKKITVSKAETGKRNEKEITKTQKKSSSNRGRGKTNPQ
jgi:hypothetical protein